MRLLSTVAVILCAPCLAFGQPSGGSPAFETASVKPSRRPAGGTITVAARNDPGGIKFTNVTLKILIQEAYKVKPYQVTGPSWIDDERSMYDIVAKAPAGASKEQFPAMLQTLLAERFKAAVHRETREVTGYALVAARGPAQLKKSKEAPPGARGAVGLMPVPGGLRVDARRATMTSFAQLLSVNLGRPVSDMTGIQGNYDIVVEFSGEGLADNFRLMIARAEHNAAPETAPDGARLPSLFDAIVQLGLKLEPRKVPVEIIVLDKAEKVPTEN